jgi:hypothetical protein
MDTSPKGFIALTVVKIRLFFLVGVRARLPSF